MPAWFIGWHPSLSFPFAADWATAKPPPPEPKKKPKRRYEPPAWQQQQKAQQQQYAKQPWSAPSQYSNNYDEYDSDGSMPSLASVIDSDEEQKIEELDSADDESAYQGAPAANSYDSDGSMPSLE